MLTRCPHCQTAFRVTAEQLKIRQGQVRCGQCRAVFDALESLVDEAPLVIAGLSAAIEPPAKEPPAEELPAGQMPEKPSAGQPASSEMPEPVEVEPAPAIEPDTPPVLAVPAETPRAPAEETAASEAMPETWGDIETVSRPRRWPWALGALLLLLTAAGQALYIFRVEVAVLEPELRPLLVAGCELIGCTLSRPRKPELVGIEASDLVPAGGERLLLTATIENRAPFDQEYPHLELSLTDRNDDTLLRKVLAPADYLPAAAPAGFAARDEVAIKLLLEARGIAAVGYRLYLFYP